MPHMEYQSLVNINVNEINDMRDENARNRIGIDTIQPGSKF